MRRDKFPGQEISKNLCSFSALKKVKYNSPLLQHLLLSSAENGILDEGFYHFKELLGFPGSLPSIQDIDILLNFCLSFYVSHGNLIIRPVEEHRLEEGNVFPSLQ